MPRTSRASTAPGAGRAFATLAAGSAGDVTSPDRATPLQSRLKHSMSKNCPWAWSPGPPRGGFLLPGSFGERDRSSVLAPSGLPTIRWFTFRALSTFRNKVAEALDSHPAWPRAAANDTSEFRQAKPSQCLVGIGVYKYKIKRYFRIIPNSTKKVQETALQ